MLLASPDYELAIMAIFTHESQQLMGATDPAELVKAEASQPSEPKLEPS
jgi:hypothetical protein